MDSKTKNDILSQTLSLVDKPFDKWNTYNDKINTVLFFEDNIKGIPAAISEDELPMLECRLVKSYFLITTKQLISQIDDRVSKIEFTNISKFGNNKETQSNIKVSTITLYNLKGEEFLYKIDSLYPAYFSRILIHNLISFYKKGVLSWSVIDPK